MIAIFAVEVRAALDPERAASAAWRSRRNW
jgi:hypothetical protein